MRLLGDTQERVATVCLSLERDCQYSVHSLTTLEVWAEIVKPKRRPMALSEEMKGGTAGVAMGGGGKVGEERVRGAWRGRVKMRSREDSRAWLAE